MDATMTTPEAEVALDPDALPSVEPPPIPQLPAGASRREPMLRQFAQRIVDKLGAPAALLLAAELDEAVAERERGA
jgi:hypothetical protein